MCGSNSQGSVASLSERPPLHTCALVSDLNRKCSHLQKGSAVEMVCHSKSVGKVDVVNRTTHCSDCEYQSCQMDPARLAPDQLQEQIFGSVSLLASLVSLVYSWKTRLVLHPSAAFARITAGPVHVVGTIHRMRPVVDQQQSLGDCELVACGDGQGGLWS